MRVRRSDIAMTSQLSDVSKARLAQQLPHSCLRQHLLHAGLSAVNNSSTFRSKCLNENSSVKFLNSNGSDTEHRLGALQRLLKEFGNNRMLCSHTCLIVHAWTLILLAKPCSLVNRISVSSLFSGCHHTHFPRCHFSQCSRCFGPIMVSFVFLYISSLLHLLRDPLQSSFDLLSNCSRRTFN